MEAGNIPRPSERTTFAEPNVFRPAQLLRGTGASRVNQDHRQHLNALLRAKAFTAFAILVLAAASIFAGRFSLHASAQNSSRQHVTPQDFVGIWTASFQDKVFMTLWIHHSRGKWTGELSNGEVAFDAQGNLSNAQARPGKKSIQIDKVEGDQLYFHSAGDHPLHFIFKFTDANHAQLSVVNPSPNGVLQPKPFVMTRSTAHQ